MDLVFHTAGITQAQDESDYRRHNTLGTRAVAQAIAQARARVLISCSRLASVTSNSLRRSRATADGESYGLFMAPEFHLWPDVQGCEA